jgi:hypothetical protein
MTVSLQKQWHQCPITVIDFRTIRMFFFIYVQCTYNIKEADNVLDNKTFLIALSDTEILYLIRIFSAII